ncbi:NUDIX hydrolase [Pseudalkalibacillus sp. Hm43]|uniref:NUDIX hydrolase n=1 Tax=Pseudalkalibacillus sp. Hm43 TaxID=3450742 RepID=UPI003F42F76E
MTSELIEAFDENQNSIGVFSRDEVHRKGYWHHTFHYWLIRFENDVPYIYFQIRSKHKADYPGLLDITAAGHLMANESIEDGKREVQEEIGLDVELADLDQLGIIHYSLKREDFIDNELAHTFLHRMHNDEAPTFKVQEDEVSGIVKSEFDLFKQFCFKEIEELEVEGFQMFDDGDKQPIHKKVTRNHFVPHEDDYFETISSKIDSIIKG